MGQVFDLETSPIIGPMGKQFVLDDSKSDLCQALGCLEWWDYHLVAWTDEGTNYCQLLACLVHTVDAIQVLRDLVHRIDQKGFVTQLGRDA